MRPLFVVGCHRSGTTLLRRIVSSHPRIWLAKETQYAAWLGAGDWHAPRDLDALRTQLAWIHPFLTGTGWDDLPPFAAFEASDAPRTWAGLYRWVCTWERPKERDLLWWGDNTPRYVSLVPELDAAFPDARYLHVVRDPRDVVASALQVWFGGNTALTAAAEWVERVGAGLAAGHLVGDRLLLVKFEDLLTDTGGTLARIGAHLDVDPAGFRPDDLGGDAAAVARQRHLANVGKPLDPSAIGRWRTSLTPDQVADVEQVTQPLARALGYAVEAWRPAWNPSPRFRRYAADYARCYAVNVLRGVRRRLGLG